MISQSAVILTNGLLKTMYAKTCHGLLRGTERYDIVGVIDSECAGLMTNDVVPGEVADVPIYASLNDVLGHLVVKPECCIVGVAFEGGALPDSFRTELLDALKHGISVVNGLHTVLSDDEVMSAAAARSGALIIDIRKPKPFENLQFWSGKIKDVRAKRIAVLGMDCAVGKRTTCSMLLKASRAKGLSAEMIYTGQTGWLQGYPYGCIVDSTLNDFVSGELEHAVYQCNQELKPDLIFIEGQSSLRNPSGPFGAELLLSVQAKQVILQHDPRRVFFDDNAEVGYRLPSVTSEIALIERYGAHVLAVALHPGMKPRKPEMDDQMTKELGLPVVWAGESGIEQIVDIIQPVALRWTD